MNTITIGTDEYNIGEIDLQHFKINITGDNNNICLGNRIPENKKMQCVIRINGSNNIIKIENTLHPCHINLLLQNKSSVFIDRNFLSWGINIHCFSNNVHIGRGNLFAANVTVLPSDGHFIYDKESKKLLNNPADIYRG